MRFEISPEGDNLLPLVTGLRDEKVGTLEGYNGVGKTLLSTLLQICTGTQPFVSLDQQARWEGIRDGFGRLTLTASGLRGGRVITWKIDSRLWPASLSHATDVSDDWFQVEIDGIPAHLADVKRLLHVSRIAGNEGILETLADLADRERATVDRYVRATAPRVDEVGAVLRQLKDLLGAIRPGMFEAGRARAQAASALRDDSRRRLDSARASVRAIETAIESRNQFALLSASGPELEATLRSQREAISELQKENSDALDRIRALSPRVAESAEASEQLKTANTSLKRVTSRLTNVSADLAKAAAEADISDPTDAESTIEEVVAAATASKAKRKAISRRPELLALLNELDRPLRGAHDRQLGDQVIATDPRSASRRWSVDEVYSAIGVRRQELIDQPLEPEAAAADLEVARLETRLSALRTIPRLRREVESAGRAVATANERVRELNRQASNPATDEITELQKRSGEITEQLVRLGGEEARTGHQLRAIADGRTLDEAKARLAEAEASVPPHVTDLDAGLHEFTKLAERLAAEFTQASDAARDAADEETLAREQAAHAAAAIDREPRFAWLADENAAALPAPDADAELLVPRLERLSAAVEAADDALGRIQTGADSTSYALRLVARQLRGTPDAESPPALPLVRDWLAGQAAGWLQEPSVREFILPEATGELQVHLDDRRVVGRRADGTPISKPLEGFSSGEQAFAFTQAQLAVLDRAAISVSTQRLIILDEFGAFIASEGRDELARQLRAWSVKHPDDQIVVILPTTQDYETLALAAIDQADAAEFARRAKCLDDQQYFSAAFEV